MNISNNNSTLLFQSSIGCETSQPYSSNRPRSLKMKRISAKDILSIVSDPYKSTKTQQQQQQQQPKNYVQKLYEIKCIHPIEFDLIGSSGPAHKPRFEMKLKLNTINETFISSGISKKQAKLNASKEALKYLTNLDANFRTKYLNENEVLEIKNLFLQEINEVASSASDSNISANGSFSNLALNDSSFVNDSNINTNLFTNFTKSSNESVSLTSLTSSSSTSSLVTNKPKKLNNLSSNNPISLLTELLPIDSYKFNFVDEWGESHAKQFKIQLIVKNPATNGKTDATSPIEKIFYAIGSSKKQAKSRVAQIAIEDLYNLKLNTNSNTLPTVYDDKFKKFADAIGAIIKDKYLENLNKLNTTTNGAAATTADSDAKLRTVYAAIVQTNDDDLNIDNSKIICLTSGTKCINGEFMSQTGHALNDCHAEILACRLLRKYLYEQLEIYLNYLSKKSEGEALIDDLILNENNFIFEIKDENDDDDKNDFTVNDTENGQELKTLFRLKNKIKFHLFISTTPCGDGRIFAPHENHTGIDNHPNRKIRGLLRAKLESGEGTIPVGNEIKLQTWDAVLHGDRLKVMSCSDKLCKINVVGVQGALLSYFIDPVYFDSMIIGSYYHYDHLSRALYGRVEEHLSKLPINFKLNKPILSTITNTDARQLSKSSNKAYIWSNILSNIKQEIINTKDGKQADSKISSGVCKFELFTCWLNLFKKLIENKNMFKLNDYLIKLNQETKSGEFNYSNIKQKSSNYQKAKLCVYEAFKKASLGCWITKPFEQDYFDLK